MTPRARASQVIVHNLRQLRERWRASRAHLPEPKKSSGSKGFFGR